MRAATIVAQPSFFAPLQHHAAKIAAAAKELLHFEPIPVISPNLTTFSVVSLHREVVPGQKKDCLNLSGSPWFQFRIGISSFLL